ncbi:multicopper oxidase domain-containing protein [bacterium]|nr:multicopper oxidase domain-containing protein [bacterium]MBT3729803.1 multicopper oxidase domain-containing protein [bacterium]MBT4894716.1 multicopper oxidase domain-containing protein [bacterium]
MKKIKILPIVPFILIVIFGGLLTYFSFNESLKRIRAVTVDDISRSPDDLPAQINRDYSRRVSVDLEAVSVVAEFDDGKTYEYWTFNKQVPGPLIRVREGDTVNITLTHLRKAYEEQKTINSHSHSPSDIERIRSIKLEDREESDRFEYSFGFEGVELMKVGLGETKSFELKTTKPGLYIYNSGGANAPTHIARGMYGMILVEPRDGLPKVDREYYVMEGEIYTNKDSGDSGFHKLDEEELLAKNPDYNVFNGSVNAFREENALTTDVGETVRIFFGNSGQNISSFHMIGGIDLHSTLVPAGGTAIIETVSQ